MSFNPAKKAEKRKAAVAVEDENETDNNGLFYVYESKRRHLWSNLKDEQSEESHTSDDRFTRIFKRKKVQKLFDICLSFVAVNVECVENFIGFPSQIGSIIFNECVSIDKFSLKISNEPEHVNKGLQLFSQAYSDEFVMSLNLKNNFKLLKGLASSIALFQLKCLDLTNCDLNANGCNLNLIDLLNGSLCSLELLNLSDNSLDIEFISKFTLSQRLDLCSFTQLKSLNLSDNFKLSKNCLKFFHKFPKLNEIIFSCKKIDNTQEDVTFRLCKCKNVEMKQVENVGWIKRVIERNDYWDSLSVKLAVKEDTQQNKNVISKTSFYSKTPTQSIVQLVDRNNLRNSNADIYRFKRSCTCLPTFASTPIASTSNSAIKPTITTVPVRATSANKENLSNKKKTIQCNLSIDDLKQFYL